MRQLLAFALVLVVAVAARAADKEEGFVQLFNGKDMTGWKITESPNSWSIVDGALKANGNRSHLVYVGDEKPFVSFILLVDVKTEKGANGGIHFHTKFQEGGWLKQGFEAQVNNTFVGDPRKTGSLYAVKDVMESAAKDGEWWTQAVIVDAKARKITIKVNDKTVVEYDEPADHQPGKDFTRHIDKGTFALQAHDPKSVTYYKNIRVKRLD